MNELALLPENIYVCERCGHLWNERRPVGDDPANCEHCSYRYLRVFPTRIIGNDEAAEEYSENLLETRAERNA